SKKVLVVDDEADVRTFLVAVLEKHGYESRTAEDGLRALEVVREERPDLIILDLQMPHQTGTGFCRQLQRNKELARIPIIVVSGLPGRDVALPKPVAVFDKPIDPVDFINTVDEALGV
ncbi:PleD family two-component system response regulator, partial [Planctomycetota bacterium]